MIKLERNTIYRTDSRDRTFRYEVESVADKIRHMIAKNFYESN